MLPFIDTTHSNTQYQIMPTKIKTPATYIHFFFDLNAIFQQQEYVITYKGDKLELNAKRRKSSRQAENNLPVSNHLIIKTQEQKKHEAIKKGLMFLSEISWLYDTAIIKVDIHEHSTQGLSSSTDLSGHGITGGSIDLTYYKPMELDNDQMLAVGLYKEAISSNIHFFGFLGLFKILEIQMNGKQRRQYLNNFIRERRKDFNLRGEYAESLDDAEQLQFNLYKLGRCAVAHANDKDRIDTHNIHDHVRLDLYYQIIKPIVRSYMIEEMNIPELLEY